MLDTIRDVETPEGVSLELRLAGPVARGLAWSIDAGIRLAGVWLVLAVLGILGHAGTGIALLCLFFIYWLYPIVFESLNDGRTPGKRTMKLQVVNINGAPVGWLAAIVRNLLRAVDMLPLLYGFGLVSVLIDRDFRRLGDIAAGTVVIHTPPVADVAPVQEVEPSAPPPLLPEEQVALQRFAERASKLTAERQRELADILAPITGLHGEANVRQLLAYANWIIGR